jgi:NAD(P)H-hydrate epimerase
MQFRPPFRPPGAEAIERVNKNKRIRFRAAVDLPSGVGNESDPCQFRADFTYATGIAKAPLFDEMNAASVGRIRYLDIGFFEDQKFGAVGPMILRSSVLRSLGRLREPTSDKRSFGHLFAVGGSRTMPGAILMAIAAAVKSGVGLVTAFVPEAVVASFAAILPEVIWVPFPETPDGGLALDGFPLLEARLNRATALIAGPGMGTERETGVLLERIVSEVAQPMVLDADALRPDLINVIRRRGKGGAKMILTPHRGELRRISEFWRKEPSLENLAVFSRNSGVITLLKGPITTISDGQRIIHSCFGGPVLARGGSGDVLTGLVGGMLARPSTDPLAACCRSVALQGCAADLLARTHGQIAVRTTEILDFFPAALRSAK